MIVYLTVALIGGAFIGFLLGQHTEHETGQRLVDYLKAELAHYRKQYDVATDRLVHAHLEERALIPPRPVEPKPILPLPPELQQIVDEWENPEVRANVAARIQRMLDEGRGVPAIMRSFENGDVTTL